VKKLTEFEKSDICMLLMKCQSVIVHAIYRIPVLPDVDYRHIFQNVSTGKNACPCIVIKTNLFVCLGGMGQVFPVSCKVVCWWVTTNCCFVGDMFHGSSVS